MNIDRDRHELIHATNGACIDGGPFFADDCYICLCFCFRQSVSVVLICRMCTVAILLWHAAFQGRGTEGDLCVKCAHLGKYRLPTILRLCQSNQLIVMTFLACVRARTFVHANTT